MLCLVSREQVADALRCGLWSVIAMHKARRGKRAGFLAFCFGPVPHIVVKGEDVMGVSDFS